MLHIHKREIPRDNENETCKPLRKSAVTSVGSTSFKKGDGSESLLSSKNVIQPPGVLTFKHCALCAIEYFRNPSSCPLIHEDVTAASAETLSVTCTHS